MLRASAFPSIESRVAPRNRIAPDPGVRMPASSRTSVDFPHPFEPMIAPTVAGAMERDTLRMTGVFGEYPNWTSRASSSGRVISSSFLIGGENFRMDVCPKQVHGLPDELLRVKNEVVADRSYFVLAHGAQRRHRCPNCCLILTKPASRRVHDIQDDLRIERHDGFFIDG